MLKIGTVKWQAKSPRHPMFDPESDGPGAIKGGCPRCMDLQAIYESHQRTVKLMRTFGPLWAQRKKVTEREDRQQGLVDVPE